MKFSDFVTEEEFNSLSEPEFQDLLSTMSFLKMYQNRGEPKADPKAGDMYMDNDLNTHYWWNGEWNKI